MYIEIPKVACSSIKAAIARILNIDLVHGDPHQTPLPSIHYELSEHGPLYPDLFSFAFVRNPWDRLVSCYRDKILLEVDGFTHSTIRPGVADCLAHFDRFFPGMLFEQFINVVASIPDEEADEHFRSQYTFIADRANQIAVDFVGRYERLFEDLNRVRELRQLPEFELPRLQAASSSVNYREFYSDRSREIVAERFKTDIAMFEYDF
ncbi:MAG: sulfotransferase family protein [Pseudomonadales bacterium]